MRKLTKKTERIVPNFHTFPPDLQAYNREQPRVAQHCFKLWGARFAETAWLKNPTKQPQTLTIHLGHFVKHDPSSLRGPECCVHVTIEPGETRELPAPFADTAHVVDGEANQVVGGHAPSLRRLDRDESGELIDITPPLHEALAGSLPDDNPTKPRARRR